MCTAGDPGGFALGRVSPEPIQDCCVCARLPGKWGRPLSDIQVVYTCQSLVHLDENLPKLSRLRSHQGETDPMTLGISSSPFPIALRTVDVLAWAKHETSAK